MYCIYADTIYTGTSMKEKMFLLFSNRKIKGFSQHKEGHLIGEYKVLTPALIDPHSHIGMIRAGEPAAESEVNDRLDSCLPLADPLDSLHMDDPSFSAAIEMGVLYSCIVPGSANLIGGHSAVIRNYAANSTEALISRAGIKVALGYNPISKSDWQGARPTTRMGAMAILRQKFASLRKKIKQAGSKSPDLSPEEDILREVLSGACHLRVHVHKTDDIATLLRLVDEYAIKVTVEHAMDVNRPEIFQELQQRKIPVTYGPIDAFPYKVEIKHANWRNIRHLIDSRTDFGLMTDHPFVAAHQLLLQARWLLRAGMNKQQAIEVLTYKNAKLLNIHNCLGSLAKGKWASFVCWPGDPFNLENFPSAVYGEGQLLFQT